jgi:transcription elongation factor GreA
MADKFPITRLGYSRLVEEIKQLKTVERPAIIQAIATARELGDLSENAEYSAAREKQSFIEGRVLELEDKLARAEIIDVSSLSGPQIKFGATVTLLDIETDEKVTYTIVGEYEADITKRMVSIVSPIARALIGKQVGDSGEVYTPRGSKDYDILTVEYK